MIDAGSTRNKKDPSAVARSKKSRNENLLHTPARAELLLSSSAQANLRNFFDLPTPKPAVFG
jgi:hypothetical protein